MTLNTLYTLGVKKIDTAVSVSPTSKSFKSYSNTENSCYVDVGLEISYNFIQPCIGKTMPGMFHFITSILIRH